MPTIVGKESESFGKLTVFIRVPYVTINGKPREQHIKVKTFKNVRWEQGNNLLADFRGMNPGHLFYIEWKQYL